MESGIEEDLKRFYGLLDELNSGLGGMRTFKDTNARQGWPPRGVYFIFEKDERRASDTNKLRVTRIGTHAIKVNAQTRLWGRLKAHRGTVGDGGNHRGSVFREHVGFALMNRSKGAIRVPSWSLDRCSNDEWVAENTLETLVTDYIGETRILWISVNDKPSPFSDRKFIEKNAIALLSRDTRLGAPSPSWLGRCSLSKEVRTSGLWNVDHVGEKYDSRFLYVFEKYVKATTQGKFNEAESVTPRRWWEKP